MGNLYEDAKKYRKEISFGISAVVLFLFIKYVVVLFIPFIIAGIFVFIVRKPIEFIHKKTRIGKGFLAGMILLFIVLIIGAVIWYCSGWGITKLKFLIINLSYYEDQLFYIVQNCCDAVEDNLGISSLTVENLILERVDFFIDDLKIEVVPKMLNQTMMYGKWIFKGIMFLIVTLIAVVLLAKDYREIIEKAKNVTIFNECISMVRKLLRLVGAYVRAQIEIIIVVSLICFLGFVLSGYKLPYVWGIITGVLDVLPFVGTGIILLPLAILQFLMGNGLNAVILVITFIVSALARELLEPKLIGKKMGVIPIVILVSVYVGAKVFGMAGVIWGPLYILILYEIYKRLYHIK